MAVFRVDKNKDYTIMSNHHLRDKTLSLKAKGLLSLMLSLPDNWDYTLNGLAAICTDGIFSIRAAVNELESAGFLKRSRIRNTKGQLTDTEYTILEKPEPLEKQSFSPTCGNCTQDESEPKKPMCGFPTLDNQTLGKPTLGNQTQLNTNKQNTKESITNQSIHQTGVKVFPETDTIRKIESSRELIRKNIEYDTLTEHHDAERVEELVELMAETICLKNGSVRIGKSECPIGVVRAKLLKVNAPHIEYVLRCLDTNTTKIRNIRSYLLTALCNSLTTIENYYRAEVNHDLSNTYGGNFYE